MQDGQISPPRGSRRMAERDVTNVIGDKRARVPWHKWVLSAVSLRWFAGGANDFVMNKTENAAYLGMAADSMGVSVETVLPYFNGYPLGTAVCWALGVWCAVAGSILLLFRSRFAFHALVVSLIGMAV